MINELMIDELYD